MIFDYLLQFYWPSGQVRPGKEATRRLDRRVFLFGGLRQKRAVMQFVVIVCTCAALMFSGSALALHKLTDKRTIVFDRLGSDQGLTQAGITTIVQDAKGFIWIGTQEGLYRFDGYNFKTYYHVDNDPGSLSHDTIWDLCADAKGLWIGTDGGLDRYNERTGKFKAYNLDTSEGAGGRHNIVHVVYEDHSGTLWIGTDADLVRRNPDGSFTHFEHNAANPNSLGRGAVRAIFQDNQGRLWIGTELGGLNLMNQKTGTFKHYRKGPGSLSDNYIRSIIENHGKLWISTFHGGVDIFNPATGKTKRLMASRDHPGTLASNTARALLKDQDGNIWVGTDRGLDLWNPATRSFTLYRHDPTDPHSLSDNTVMDLYQDRGGVIWVGTYNGVSRWNANIETFPHYKRGTKRRNGLNDNNVTSFAEMPNRNVWIGTFGGLNRWNAKTGKFDKIITRKDGLSDDTVMALATHGKDLWVGTMTGGVDLVRNGKVVETFTHDPNDPTSLSSNAVSAILVDSKGRTWFTTYGAGVDMYLGDGKFEHFPRPGNPNGQFSDLRAVDIAEAPDGRLWVATDGGGVVILDPSTGDTQILRKQAGDPGSLNSNNVITLRYALGTMWVGTRDHGLNRYERGSMQFVHYTKSDGLPSDEVFGMLGDPKGNLWVSSSKGLSVLDPSNGHITTYDETHGLQSEDFNSGASFELRDGTFLFGGGNGFNAFNPEHVRGNTYVPPIVVTEFSKFNEPFKLKKPIWDSHKITLNYDAYVIGFEFTAMDFTEPDKNRFQYKLVGFDRNWVDAKPGTHQVTYTNLDPGHYTFRVRGSNNDGVWNEKGASINLTVKPPIWATWWAYLVYLILGIMVIYQGLKANGRRQRREAEKRYSERLQLYIESLEEATDCVLIADANKNLMYANNAIKTILGLSPTQAVGRSILSLLFSNPEDADLARHGLKTDGRWHGEVKTRYGAHTITTEVTIAAVRDDSQNETAYVAITRDITERKRTEAELENHRRNLEFLVAERTKALEREIAENKAVQRELANSLKEKELLLKEVHHRVKNNMQVISSLLNIQGETIDNEEFANLLGESQQRIKSMSLIHENLYQSDNLLEIDFEDYIRMLANSLCRFYTIPGVSINLDIHVDNVKLDIETAVPVGLVINELISNSLKHAFKGKQGCGTISVSFRQVGCRYVLQINDDGVGLPEGFEPASASSMGMEIVSILTQQLDGRLHIDGSHGARFEISFPRQEKANA